jgi:hypothetical protein
MNVVIKCIWRDKVPQQRLPPELWAYDPLQHVIRSCKRDAALLPFSVAVRDELQYYGDADPAPTLIPQSLISMHSTQIDDLDLFNEDLCLAEIVAKPQIVPEDVSKKNDVESPLSKYSCLFSTGQSDLGKIANPEISHRIVVHDDATPPTRLIAMSQYSEREREFMIREIQMLMDLGIVQPTDS